MKKLIISIILLVIPMFNISLAEDAGWTLIPEGEGDLQAESVGDEAGKVWENYNEAASTLSNSGEAFASGIFSWQALFWYFQYLAKTLSQIGLIVGAIMIIYAGYKYATGVFTGDASKGGKDAIKSAIYGVLIVIFSYTIMKLLISTFL